MATDFFVPKHLVPQWLSDRQRRCSIVGTVGSGDAITEATACAAGVALSRPLLCLREGANSLRQIP
jgi:hypothetical protein